MKGIEPLIAAVFIILISVIGIVLVLEFSQPSIGKLEEISLFKEAKDILTQIDNTVRDVAQQGEGSARVLTISVGGGNYFIDTDKEAVIFSMESKSQIIGVGISKTEGNINMFGELNTVLLNISYSIINITEGGSFGKGYHSLIIRNNGYDIVNQKQIISVSLLPPVLPPTALTVQFDQDNSPSIVFGTNIGGTADNLNTLGEGLTYDVEEIEIEEQEIKIENLIPNESFEESVDMPLSSCGTNLDVDDSNYCGNLLGIDKNGEWGYVNSTHSLDILSNAEITNVTVCWNGYFDSKTNDITGDESYIRIGENSTGVWIYTDIDSCIDTACNFYSDIERCYDVTSIINTVDKARNIKISLYNIEADDMNQDIFDDYNYVNITYNTTTYRLEIWHNSTQISYSGTLYSINVTINFTTNVSDYYSFQMYNWLNSQWTGCDSGNIAANTPMQWWCTEFNNPENYFSPENIVRIRISSTADSDTSLLKEDYIQYYVNYIP